MSKQFTHFTIGPGEYGPFMVARSHLQEAGLPFAGTVETSCTPVHSFASILPLANGGRGANSAFLYSGVVGYFLGTSHLSISAILGFLIFRPPNRVRLLLA